MDSKADLFSFNRLLWIKGKGPYKPMSLLPKSILEIILTYDFRPSKQLPCPNICQKCLESLFTSYIDNVPHVILLFPP